MPKKGASHLIPVKKHVRRGKGHTQTFYVRADEVEPAVKAAMKEAKEKDIGFLSGERARDEMPMWSREVEKLGGNPAIAHDMLSAWSASSTHPEALTLRGAASHIAADSDEEEHALARRDMRAGLAAAISVGGTRYSNEAIAEYRKIAADPAEDQWRRASARTELEWYDAKVAKIEQDVRRGMDQEHVDTLSAVSAMSQAMYAEPVVQVYRGIHGAQRVAMEKAIEQAKARGDDHIEIDTGTISSFSEAEGEAVKFAKWVAKSESPGTHVGYTFRVDAPREAIAFSHRAVPQLEGKYVKGKKEVALLTKGRIRVPLANITPILK